MQNVEDVYPLSPIQEGMLSHTIRAPRSGVFVEQYVCTLRGAFDTGAFRAAWADTIARHPALRTAFLWDGLDEPLQVVRREAEAPWRLEDWRGLDAETLEARWHRLLETDRTDGLDLARAPVMRMTLVRTDEAERRFLWTFHHLLTDGWSTPLVLRDALAAYATRLGHAPPLRSTPRPYRDYIAWLQHQDHNQAETFWTKHLAGFDTPTALAFDGVGAPRREGAGRHRLVLPDELTERLRGLARRHRVTLNTVVQAAWALLLHRYSGADDVVYGATVAGRPADLPGVEEMVGLFISTLPVRTRLRPDTTLGHWLRALQAQLVEVRQFAYTPLVDIQRRSGVRGETPLFESIVVFENYPAVSTDELGDLDLELHDIRYIEQSNFPLAVLALPGDTLEFLFVYDTARLADAAVARIGAHLAVLLHVFADDTDTPVAELPVLPPAERRTLLHAWNATDAPFPANRTVVDLIDEQAARSPEAPAVFFRDEMLSYGALVDRADRLARVLRGRGVEADVPVGVALDRSVDLVVGLLAVLKAGGAYVPLDPAYPAERLRLMLADAHAPVVLTRRRLADDLPAAEAAVVFVDDASDPASGDELPHPQPEHLAYVIYTSGSTGRPKGVAVTHRNLMHATAARFATYGDPVGRFLLLSSYAFDSSVAGLFWTLTTGGALVLPPERQEQDLAGLADLIARRAVTHTLTLPSLYGLLLDHAPADRLTSLRTVIVAGEACPPAVVGRHHARLPGAALYNEYGPTEATVWCTVHRTTPVDADGPVPIGRPIDRTRVYLLDVRGRLVPIGLPGELYVGGAGLAQGYLHRPEATAERFLAPGEALPDERVYRTGDLARYRPDGVLDFLGRVDEQVKIRGYRIEPAEIEAALARHPAVREAVVTVARPASSTGSARLVAYVAADGALDPSALRDRLRAQLPDHMVPAAVVALDSLPRLPNGKIDRRALPAPEQTAPAADAGFVGPRSATERRLAQIWTDVLGLDQIGIHDHFFELGGDSILSIHVVSRARQAGLTLAPNDLFAYPTVAELAARAEEADAPAAAETTRTGPVPLSPIQHWFFDTFRAAPHHWNQAVLIDTDPDVDPDLLEQAFRPLLDRHDGLRLGFPDDGAGRRARIAPTPGAFAVRRVSLAGQSDDAREQTIARIAAETQAGFDLDDPPLLRAVFFDGGPGRLNSLLLVAHHLVIDVVSWQIVLDDLAHAYERLRRNEAVDLPPVPTTYRAWVEALAEADVSAERAYWTADAADLPPDADPGLPSTEADAETLEVDLDAETTRSLLTDANTAYRTRPDELMLAALAEAVAERSDADAVRIGRERHGRAGRDDAPDLTRTVGWLTTVFPVVLRLPGGAAAETIKAVKEQLRGVPNEGLGYGVLRYLHDAEALRNHPHPTLLFNYLGRREETLRSAPFRRLRVLNRSARSALSERSYPLELNAAVGGGRLCIRWTYDPRAFRPETVERLAQAHLDALRRLVAHCTGADAGGYTPSDFPEVNLSQDELDAFLDSLS